jgi:hypothetical protein
MLGEYEFRYPAPPIRSQIDPGDDLCYLPVDPVGYRGPAVGGTLPSVPLPVPRISEVIPFGVDGIPAVDAGSQALQCPCWTSGGTPSTPLGSLDELDALE